MKPRAIQGKHCVFVVDGKQVGLCSGCHTAHYVAPGDTDDPHVLVVCATCETVSTYDKHTREKLEVRPQ